MKLSVRRTHRSPRAQDIEVVERKGLGHPDTICDAVSEHVSVALTRYYLEHFGRILHHNVDKVLLCGGATRVAFGDGEILAPMEIYIGGRASHQHDGHTIPVHEIAVDACRDWIRGHLKWVSLERGLNVFSKLRPGAENLTHMVDRAGPIIRANDTSCGVGFSPFSDLECVVLAIEERLNSPEIKSSYPAIGTDIKVMGIRQGHCIDLTIGCAFIGPLLRDMSEYSAHTDVVRQIASEVVQSLTGLEANIIVNAADNPREGDVFLTLTGTSAESGDDGETGRGNRVCGLITPCRPMTIEASAGKNPASHVGKLYPLVAHRVAERITTTIPNVTDATCMIVSQIGQDIANPQIVVIDVALPDPASIETIASRAEVLIKDEFHHLDELRKAMLREEVRLF